jgi:hypothetical protein
MVLNLVLQFVGASPASISEGSSGVASERGTSGIAGRFVGINADVVSLSINMGLLAACWNSDSATECSSTFCGR